MYQTTVCIYYDPELLGLTGLYMTMREMNINPNNADWKPELMVFFQSRKAEVEEVYMEFKKRLNNLT